MRPIAIPKKISAILTKEIFWQQRAETIRKNYIKLRKTGIPAVSIVIPAYNEEENILRTLHSLTQNVTNYAVEIIVVDNNSRDKTQQMVLATGVGYILERTQGITAARTAGLHAAKGKFIMNADADAVYPIHWVEQMIAPLDRNKSVAITYGRFSFIPVGKANRLMYFFYEHAADVLRYFNKYFKEEAVNVYGFNSAYRRTDGFIVNGYEHPKGANEDGYLALKLRNQGCGRLHYVTNSKALVWTTDRRLQIEGGFIKGVEKRIKKLLFPAQFVQVRTDL